MNMCNRETHSKMVSVLFLMLLSGVALTGCRGSLGWGHANSSIDRQDPPGLYPSPQAWCSRMASTSSVDTTQKRSSAFTAGLAAHCALAAG